jgi:hypothetical protein
MAKTVSSAQIQFVLKFSCGPQDFLLYSCGPQDFGKFEFPAEMKALEFSCGPQDFLKDSCGPQEFFSWLVLLPDCSVFAQISSKLLVPVIKQANAQCMAFSSKINENKA